MPYKIYISGPISGHVDGNEKAFRVAAARLQADIGAETVVPHDLYMPDSPCRCMVWCKGMVIDLEELAKCDAVYFILGWHLSTGARRELVEANKRGLRLIFE